MPDGNRDFLLFLNRGMSFIDLVLIKLLKRIRQVKYIPSLKKISKPDDPIPGLSLDLARREQALARMAKPLSPQQHNFLTVKLRSW
jgi:hypothetical protein